MRIHPLSILLAGLLPSYAGVVVDLSGEALPNVTVSQGSLEGLTTRGGTWSLLPTQIVRSFGEPSLNRLGLHLDGSHLRIDHGNRNLAGRADADLHDLTLDPHDRDADRLADDDSLAVLSGEYQHN